MSCASGPLGEQVQPAVSDAAERQRAVLDERDDDGRAHAGQIGLLLAGLEDLAVRQAHGGDETIGVQRDRRIEAEWPGEIAIVPAASRKLRTVSTAMREATSPAWCPPMPSATTNSPAGRSHSNASSLFERTRPG